MHKVSLYWFRNDLRLKDNVALTKAIKASEKVIPFYCLDEKFTGPSEYNSQKMGDFRLKFLLESLQDLELNLIQKNAGLIFRKGNTAAEIKQLIEKYNIEAIYFSDEIGQEEKAIAKSVKNLGLPCFSTESKTLCKEGDLPFSISNLPDVFSQFRNKTEKHWSVRAEIPVPDNIPSISVEKINWQEWMPTVAESEKASFRFVGGESEAWKRLQSYFWETKNIGIYKETRNQLMGSNFSSRFSPWLALGCISAVSIYNDLKKYEESYNANESTYWLLFELMWRDYFHFVHKKYGNQIFQLNGLKDQTFYHVPNEIWVEKWKNGETGIPFIDANMRELNQTGWMSNRGRQNVASFLCKDLKQDWRLGAAYFEEKLIDYDVSSNWGNWAYVAGVGNDPRESRWFNVIKQNYEYDRWARYVKHWIPELEKLPDNLAIEPWKAEIEYYILPIFLHERW